MFGEGNRCGKSHVFNKAIEGKMNAFCLGVAACWIWISVLIHQGESGGGFGSVEQLSRQESVGLKLPLEGV